MKILKEFRSRKNKVRLREESGERYIEKIYTDSLLAKRAYEVYSDIRLSVLCPNVIRYSDNTIIMQYIQGETLLDIFTRAQDNIKEIIDCLIDSINSLYSASYIQTDTNFSNYIISNNKCYTIDFDEIVRAGKGYDYSDCIADIILFALTYDDIDIYYKMAFVKELICRVDVSSLSEYIERAKERYYDRRNREFEQNIALQEILGYRQ